MGRYGVTGSPMEVSENLNRGRDSNGRVLQRTSEGNANHGEGSRDDVVVDLAGRDGQQRVVEVEAGERVLLRGPDAVQRLATDAAGEVGVELFGGRH